MVTAREAAKLAHKLGELLALRVVLVLLADLDPRALLEDAVAGINALLDDVPCGSSARAQGAPSAAAAAARGRGGRGGRGRYRRASRASTSLNEET